MPARGRYIPLRIDTPPPSAAVEAVAVTCVDRLSAGSPSSANAARGMNDAASTAAIAMLAKRTANGLGHAAAGTNLFSQMPINGKPHGPSNRGRVGYGRGGQTGKRGARTLPPTDVPACSHDTEIEVDIEAGFNFFTPIVPIPKI